MKIKVTLIVDLPDPAQWTAVFGVEGAQAIRQSVRDYIAGDLSDFGVFGNGEVDATITVQT